MLDGNKNGNGKEYYRGKLIFDGKFLNGERNGKGKEYKYRGYGQEVKLFFEGEYLNGKRWNGKGYDKNGELDFEVKDGKGKGKEYSYHNFFFGI